MIASEETRKNLTARGQHLSWTTYVLAFFVFWSDLVLIRCVFGLAKRGQTEATLLRAFVLLLASIVVISVLATPGLFACRRNRSGGAAPRRFSLFFACSLVLAAIGVVLVMVLRQVHQSE